MVDEDKVVYTQDPEIYYTKRNSSLKITKHNGDFVVKT